MRTFKIVLATFVALVFITGCENKNKLQEGVTIVPLPTFTEEELAMLTGDKNLKQIKQDYVTAVMQENKKEKTIYAHWLDRYGDKDPSFNFRLFRLKIENDQENLVKEIEEKIKDIEAGKMSVEELRHQKDFYSFLALKSKVVRERYIPAINHAIARHYQIKKEQEDAAKLELERQIYGVRGRRTGDTNATR